MRTQFDGQFEIDPEIKTRLHYKNIVIDVTHFQEDSEEAEMITKFIEKKGSNSTYEGWAIDNMKPNSVIYTQKSDHEIAALASSKKRKIRTEKLIVISGNKTRPRAGIITKVTLL